MYHSCFIFYFTTPVLRLYYHGNGGGIKQDDSTQLLTGFFFTARIFHFTWLSPTTTDPHHHTHTNSEAVTGSPWGAGVLHNLTRRRASTLSVPSWALSPRIFPAALTTTHPPQGLGICCHSGFARYRDQKISNHPPTTPSIKFSSLFLDFLGVFPACSTTANLGHVEDPAQPPRLVEGQSGPKTLKTSWLHPSGGYFHNVLDSGSHYSQIWFLGANSLQISSTYGRITFHCQIDTSQDFAHI